MEGPGCHGNSDKTSQSQSERDTQKHASNPGRDLCINLCGLVRGDSDCVPKEEEEKKGWMGGRKAGEKSRSGIKEGLLDQDS